MASPVRSCLLLLCCLASPAALGCAGSPGLSSNPEFATAPAEASTALVGLWKERTSADGGAPLAIKPGDVLEISVAGLEELALFTGRVSSLGTVSMPLLGAVKAAGLSDDEFAESIRRRLAGNIMHDPSVVVFLKESRRRTVGVIGAVYKPGFYPLVGRDDTLLDAISLAGGLTDKAASHVLLHPAPADGSGAIAVIPVAHPGALGRRDAITIDFDPASGGVGSAYLNLPIRPGDVIVLPERGRVLVKGWIHEPGSYDISSGLTVLGAVVSAGGLRYAADPGDVTLIRKAGNGRVTSTSIDLSEVESGQQTDLPVLSGDVIDVSHSAPKVVVSSVYEFITSVFKIGASAF